MWFGVFRMAENKLYGYITIRQFLNSIHRCTEWVRIKVVNDVFGERKAPSYLSENVFALQRGEQRNIGEDELNRILEYYGDVHVWNVHAIIEEVHGHIEYQNNSMWYTPVIEANVSFSEVRDAWYREKADMQREKRRMRRLNRRMEQDEA